MKFYSLQKEDKTFYPTMNEGGLSKVPVVYTKIGVAKQKAGLFKGSKVVEVFPTHQLVINGFGDGSTIIYFLSLENFNEVKNELSLENAYLYPVKNSSTTNPHEVKNSVYGTEFGEIDLSENFINIDSVISQLTQAKYLGATHIVANGFDGGEPFLVIH